MGAVNGIPCDVTIHWQVRQRMHYASEAMCSIASGMDTSDKIYTKLRHWEWPSKIETLVHFDVLCTFIILYTWTDNAQRYKPGAGNVKHQAKHCDVTADAFRIYTWRIDSNRWRHRFSQVPFSNKRHGDSCANELASARIMHRQRDARA